MRFYITLALCAACLAGAYITAGIGVSRAMAATSCQEDSACWNWATMGNHQRGWVSVWGTPKVGGPCHFALALHEGRIFRYSTLQRQHGDATALKSAAARGCGRPKSDRDHDGKFNL